jgi:hypothetical protein
MSAASGSTDNCACRRCGAAAGASRTILEWVVVICFSLLHMGAFIGDDFDRGTCRTCRGKTLRWALPLALLLAGLMSAGALLLLRTALG